METFVLFFVGCFINYFAFVIFRRASISVSVIATKICSGDHKIVIFQSTSMIFINLTLCLNTRVELMFLVRTCHVPEIFNLTILSLHGLCHSLLLSKYHGCIAVSIL
jgi:hypothetical protein